MILIYFCSKSWLSRSKTIVHFLQFCILMLQVKCLEWRVTGSASIILTFKQTKNVSTLNSEISGNFQVPYWRIFPDFFRLGRRPKILNKPNSTQFYPRRDWIRDFFYQKPQQSKSLPVLFKSVYPAWAWTLTIWTKRRSFWQSSNSKNPLD